MVWSNFTMTVCDLLIKQSINISNIWLTRLRHMETVLIMSRVDVLFVQQSSPS